jgi:hypothetical protein
MDDLKKKIQDMERQGVEATAEVQMAARKVAAENRLLRQLLASHGISTLNVDEALLLHHHQHYDGTRLGQPNAIIPIPNHHMQKQQQQQQQRGTTSQIPLTTTNTVAAVVTGHSRVAAAAAATAQTKQSTPSEHDKKKMGNRNGNGNHGPPPPPPTTAHGRHHAAEADVDVVADNNNNNGAEFYTSCEDAAMIIAGMRWHGDHEKALEELGCVPNRSCRIENSDLLQAMDA